MKTAPLTTIASIRASLISTVSTLLEYDSHEFYNWQSAKLGNDLWLSDPDRMQRIHDAAEHGADGSTHAEHIEDFCEYAKEHYEKLNQACSRLSTDSTDPAEIATFEKECETLEREIESAESALDDDLDRLEKWHENNGSLNQQCG